MLIKVNMDVYLDSHDGSNFRKFCPFFPFTKSLGITNVNCYCFSNMHANDDNNSYC